MIARTPLVPYVTFCDDPLRVLRTLRFTARYNLNIESETAESMVNPFVCLRLGSIVSRERIGVEISGLVRGDYAQSVLENYVLNEKGIFLLNAVFQCGTSCWRGIDIDLSIRALSAVN